MTVTDKHHKKITQEILSLKADIKKDILTPDEISNHINNWGDYELEEKKKIAHLFIKVITITNDEIQIIFN